jgi:hypothetical protein
METGAASKLGDTAVGRGVVSLLSVAPIGLPAMLGFDFPAPGTGIAKKSASRFAKALLGGGGVNSLFGFGTAKPPTICSSLWPLSSGSAALETESGGCSSWSLPGASTSTVFGDGTG